MACHRDVRRLHLARHPVRIGPACPSPAKAAIEIAVALTVIGTVLAGSLARA